MKVLLLLACFLGACVASEPRKRYDGYKVYALTPATIEELEVIKALREHIELDFWSEPHKIGKEIHILTPPEKQAELEQICLANDIRHATYIGDVQGKVDEFWADLDETRQTKKAFDIDYWNTYDDILPELDRMAERCSPDLTCETYLIGQSFEGRDLKALKISSGEGKRAIYIDALIHAREWLAGATVLKIMDRMTRNYDSDDTVRRMLDNYDFYFLPLVNPDGYEYSWEVDRFWRKSRNVNPDSLLGCMGTDLNRNYDYFWGTGGSSALPCAEDYMGGSAGSESETIAVQNEALRLGDSVIAWVSVHTAAQMWLLPYGYVEDGACKRPDDHFDLQRVANAACDAIMTTWDTFWECGNGCEILYSTTGSTIDYVKGVAGVKYSYTPELRGPFFDPPINQIEPSYTEVWNGIVAMVDEITAVEGGR